MQRVRSVAGGVLLACLGVLFGFVMIEATVRMLHLVQDRFWEPDPLLGVRHIRGKSGWWTQEDHEFRVPVQMNAHGLRDVDHAYAKPVGRARVLVLGDSFVEALQVPLEQSLGRRLATILGDRFEVISAGVSGYGTASQSLFLQTEGWRYDPDIVVVAFFPGNDVKNNSPTMEDIIPPVYDAEGNLQRVSSPFGGDPSVWQTRKSWRDRSDAYRFTRQILLQHPALAGPLHRWGVLGADKPLQPHERDGVPIDYEVFGTEPSAEWQAAWDHTFHLLADIRASVQQHGRRLLVVVIPPRYLVYPAWWGEVLASHPAMSGRAWDVSGPTKRIVEWCARQAIACLDLAPVFIAAAHHSTPLYFHHDGHWTVAGHELAAQTLTRFLRTEHLVSEPLPN